MAAAGAAAAAIIQGIKASGVIVRVEPREFSKLLGRVEVPLIVTSQGGVFRKNYQYLMSYKGIGFFTQASQPLTLPASAELVTAQGIWVPG